MSRVTEIRESLKSRYGGPGLIDLSRKTRYNTMYFSAEEQA